MSNFVINFFYGWYIDETKNFLNWFAVYFKTLDRDIGLIGNLQNWLSPLYGDYTTAGRAIGPILRTFRIFFGAAFYTVIVVLFLMIYLFWIILPLAALTMAFLNLSVLIKAPEQVFALGKEMLNLFFQ